VQGLALKEPIRHGALEESEMMTGLAIQLHCMEIYEPRRLCRRPFGLSYAAMAGASSMA
jgi:hypothetical protein